MNWRLLPFALCLSVLLCAPGRAAVPDPVVTGPIPASQGVRGHALWDSWFDLGPFGYEEAEYFLSGTARAHPAGSAPDAAFTTRIVVFRPSSAVDFNGTVMLDWVNVTAQFENAVDSVTTFPMLLRDGYAWVHVSAQAAGVCCTPLTPKVWDPVRYHDLDHPGDAYSFDIFAQVAQALSAPAGVDPMGGLSVQRVIASGQSQSGGRLNTYVQEFQGGLGEDVIDGFIVHGSAAAGKASLSANARAPVIHLLSDAEYDPDDPVPSSSYVLWEVAGSAHSDFWIGNISELGHGPRTLLDAPKQDSAGAALVQKIAGNYGEQPHPGSLACILQGNQFPMRYPTSAAIHRLDQWLRTGAQPADGPRFEGENGSLARDEHGNARGGIRLGPIDVPIASYLSDTCALGGVSIPFLEPKIRKLYPTHADYVCRMRAETYGDVKDGWVLEPDALDLLARVDAARNRWPADQGVADCDADGVADEIDNCPLVANPGQTDSGGVDTSVPDGIGDACQCGDVSGDGVINSTDEIAINDRNSDFVVPGNCDVTGDGLCDGDDATAVAEVAGGLPNDAFGQNCQNADPFAPDCVDCGS